MSEYPSQISGPSTSNVDSVQTYSTAVEGSDLTSSRTLFVGDLSFFCSEGHLHNLFADFGPVLNVDIKRGRAGDSLMHGFVEMDTVAAAEIAMNSLNNIKFMGRKMR